MVSGNRTFCGVPFFKPDAIPKGIAAAIMGIPSALGSPKAGTENGPYFLRTLSRAYTWQAHRPALIDLRCPSATFDQVVDTGDLEFSGMPLPHALKKIEEQIASIPSEVIPCIIGGDHTVTLSAVSALATRRNDHFLVVQFDHHLDLQIWEGAPSCPEVLREPIFHTRLRGSCV